MPALELEKPTVTVLIPAHNEEKSVRDCIASALDQTVPPDEIVVVNDGSTDKTAEVVEEFGLPVVVLELELERATGNKSYAQEKGMVFANGDIVIMTDADTVLDRHFIERILPKFENEEVAAVSGYVKSLKHNWLTACREIEYAIGQQVHKLAQNYMGYVMVIPGCAAAFRAETFKECISFDHDTVAEDLDFTYKLHEQGFKIDFCRHAYVYTQDPADVRSYIYQMKRWYKGNWQNLLKHNYYMKSPMAALELSLAFTEALLFPLLLLSLLLVNLIYFFKVLLVVMMSIVIISAYAAIVDKRKDLLLYPFHYLLVLLINSIVFLSEFIKEIILRKRDLYWFQPSRRQIV